MTEAPQGSGGTLGSAQASWFSVGWPAVGSWEEPPQDSPLSPPPTPAVRPGNVAGMA